MFPVDSDVFMLRLNLHTVKPQAEFPIYTSESHYGGDNALAECSSLISEKNETFLVLYMSDRGNRKVMVEFH